MHLGFIRQTGLAQNRLLYVVFFVLRSIWDYKIKRCVRMGILLKYEIKPISYAMAMRVIVEKHYLHRKCPCSYSFGLFDGEKLLGVIVYGTPASSTLRSGVCGVENKDNVIELTRLWICDTVGKNAESFLIGNTIPMVDKEIIVSYAEPDCGHVGTVYQATNWIYTGLSAKRPNYVLLGFDRKHTTSITDEGRGQENPVKYLREKYGDKLTTVDRPRKHRYIYFNCSKTKKKQLIKKLKYKIEPYPKKAEIMNVQLSNDMQCGVGKNNI